MTPGEAGQAATLIGMFVLLEWIRRWGNAPATSTHTAATETTTDQTPDEHEMIEYDALAGMRD